jgi:hypothetical protein
VQYGPERGLHFIDVAKADFVVGCRPTGVCWTASNDSGGIAETVARLLADAPTLVVLEATGGYEMALVAALATAGRWGVGFGSTWANKEAREAANRALGRDESQKPTPEERDDPKSKYVIAFWVEREKVTQRLADLREMTCLTMMKEPLRAYVKGVRATGQR